MVDKIKMDQVVYRCDVGEILRDGRFSGKMKLHGKERDTFEKKIHTVARGWLQRCVYENINKIGNEYLQGIDNSDLQAILITLEKQCFENFYLPTIVRQYFHMSSDMVCLNLLMASVPIPTNNGDMSIYKCVLNTICNFTEYVDTSRFASSKDAIEYRTSFVQNVFDLCKHLFQPCIVSDLSRFKAETMLLGQKLADVMEQSQHIIGSMAS